jgi:hypothetical protein
MRRIWNVLIDIPRQLKRLGPKRTRAVTERPPAGEAGKPEEPQPPAEAPQLKSSPRRPRKPRTRKSPDPREGSPG